MLKVLAERAETTTPKGQLTLGIDELEIGVQLFERVLTAYQVDPGEIEDHAAVVRLGGYAALRTGRRELPLVVCDSLDEECFDTRTFTVRRGTATTPVAIGQLGLRAIAIERGTETIAPPPEDFVLQPGDRVTARASAQAFAEAARLLRGGTRTIQLTEEQRALCAKSGGAWVHLRVCMSCGVVRCCDSSPNRHATRHYETSRHPIIRSYQPGEEWAWCYPEKLTL